MADKVEHLDIYTPILDELHAGIITHVDAARAFLSYATNQEGEPKGGAEVECMRPDATDPRFWAFLGEVVPPLVEQGATLTAGVLKLVAVLV